MAVSDAKRVLPLNDEAELLSLDYFLCHTATLTKKKEYPALQQALIDYHHASTLPQCSKQVALLQQQLAGVISRYPPKSSDYLRRLRNHLYNVQIAIERYEAEPIEQLPSRLHFLCIGRPLTQSEQQHLALWKAVQGTVGSSLTLWYDSDALWVETLNHCMLEAALKQSFQQQPNSSTRIFFKQLSQNLSALRETAYREIQQALAADHSADAARQQLLLTRYQQSQAWLTVRFNEHQELIKQLTASGITVCDIHSTLASWPLAQPYQRELSQYGHLTAASQIASLQLLEQAGGIYSSNPALPALSEAFWRGVAQHAVQQQGLIPSDDPEQLDKSAATLQQAWLADPKIQAMTWQQLGQRNPAWLPVSSEAIHAVLRHNPTEESALRQAIDRYAQNNPLLSIIFCPIEPLALRRHQCVVVEGALSHHNPLLLAAHPHSKLLQAIIQQVQSHYQSLEQLEQTLHDQHQSLQDKEARIEGVKRLALSPKLARAVVDYPVEGFSVGADATQELCGIGALQQGVKSYNATQLLPSKLLNIVQNVFPLAAVNPWVNPNDCRPFSEPLRSEQTAKVWYQQSKARWFQQAKVNGEQPRLTVLDLIADHPIKPILPTVALMGGSQHSRKQSRRLISCLDKLDEYLTKKNNKIDLQVLGCELAQGLLKRVIKAIQMKNEMSGYTAVTCLQKISVIARALLGMKISKELIDNVQQEQLNRLNYCVRALNRQLLQGVLSNEIDTIVYNEVVLQPDPTGGMLRLLNCQQKLDVSTGMNGVTLPDGNFMRHEVATHKGVLFNLGEGHHQVIGVLNKANQFLLSEGRQCFTGGNQHDCFILALSAAALQRQIDRVMRQRLPLYRLEGGEGSNQLIIQSELPQPATEEGPEPQYIGYYVDLKQGRVWLRQHNPDDPEHPKDQALLLMTLHNINQLEIRSMTPSRSVIRGSDEVNRLVLHRQDTLITGGARDTVVIQGGATVQSQSGGKRYVISDQVNQLGEFEINISEAYCAAPSTLHLPVAHHQLTEWRLVDHDLIVGLGQQAQSCQLILKDVYQTVDNQRCLARDQWRLFTYDGLQLLPQWPAVVPLGTSPEITFTAYYAHAWDQRTGAAAVTSTSAGYQLQPTPPEYVTAPEPALSGRLVEDLSAVSDEVMGSAPLLDHTWTRSVQHQGGYPVLTPRAA